MAMPPAAFPTEWVYTNSPRAVQTASCWNFDIVSTKLQCFTTPDPSTITPTSPFFDAGVEFYVQSRFMVNGDTNNPTDQCAGNNCYTCTGDDNTPDANACNGNGRLPSATVTNAMAGSYISQGVSVKGTINLFVPINSPIKLYWHFVRYCDPAGVNYGGQPVILIFARQKGTSAFCLGESSGYLTFTRGYCSGGISLFIDTLENAIANNVQYGVVGTGNENDIMLFYSDKANGVQVICALPLIFDGDGPLYSNYTISATYPQKGIETRDSFWTGPGMTYGGSLFGYSEMFTIEPAGSPGTDFTTSKLPDLRFNTTNMQLTDLRADDSTTWQWWHNIMAWCLTPTVPTAFSTTADTAAELSKTFTILNNTTSRLMLSWSNNTPGSPYSLDSTYGEYTFTLNNGIITTPLIASKGTFTTFNKITWGGGSAATTITDTKTNTQLSQPFEVNVAQSLRLQPQSGTIKVIGTGLTKQMQFKNFAAEDGKHTCTLVYTIVTTATEASASPAFIVTMETDSGGNTTVLINPVFLYLTNNSFLGFQYLWTLPDTATNYYTRCSSSSNPDCSTYGGTMAGDFFSWSTGYVKFQLQVSSTQGVYSPIQITFSQEPVEGNDFKVSIKTDCTFITASIENVQYLLYAGTGEYSWFLPVTFSMLPYYVLSVDKALFATASGPAVSGATVIYKGPFNGYNYGVLAGPGLPFLIPEKMIDDEVLLVMAGTLDKLAITLSST